MRQQLPEEKQKIVEYLNPLQTETDSRAKNFKLDLDAGRNVSGLIYGALFLLAAFVALMWWLTS